METDWIVKGTIDTEQKEYILMGYFQKLNKYLEELKLYPMFIEVSVHLGSIQTIITQNKLLKTKKNYLTFDDELAAEDLITSDLPVLTEQDTEELKKVLKNTQPKMLDYFNIIKAL